VQQLPVASPVHPAGPLSPSPHCAVYLHACLPDCRHGDGHVGCRDTDDAELTRWATKQRSEHRSGQLSEEKREQLQVGWMGGWVGGRAGRQAGGWAGGPI
jgi:hypothetical protein